MPPISERRRYRRAGKACLYCRSRKVRCDVAVRNDQCTNCLLDGKNCSTPSRKTRTPSQPSGPPKPRGVTAPTSQGSYQEFSLAVPDGFAHDKESGHTTSVRSVQESQADLHIPHAICQAGEPQKEGRLIGFDAILSTAFSAPGLSPLNNRGCKLTESHLSLQSDTAIASTQRLGWVPFSNRPKLKLGKMNSISTDFIDFIEAQGCLHVPSGGTLDLLIQGYFSHFHPFMPLLDELVFWRLYRGLPSRSTQMPFISLFLMHAMLAAYCPIAPRSLIQAMGFESHKEARRNFYRRAQLLFDLDAENDITALVQGCLLLTLSHSNTGNCDKDGSYWLSIATRLAQQAGMHCEANQANLVHRRIWRCIVNRDRFMSLGVHRPLMIAPEHYSCSQSPSTTTDLFPELMDSSITLYGTDNNSMELFISACDLADKLTDIIMLINPLNGSVPGQITNSDITDEYRLSLSRWYDSTSQFRKSEDEMVRAYCEMLDIIYYSAVLALHHHDILRYLRSQSSETHSNTSLAQARQGIAGATAMLTELLNSMLSSTTLRFVTVSLFAHLIFPLIVCTINSQIILDISRLIATKHILRDLQQLLSVMTSRFDSADFIHAAVDKFGEFIRDELTKMSDHTEQLDVLSCDLRLYMRLPIFVNFCLSKGRLPRDDELPKFFYKLSHLPWDGSKAATTQAPQTDTDPFGNNDFLYSVGDLQGYIHGLGDAITVTNKSGCDPEGIGSVTEYEDEWYPPEGYVEEIPPLSLL